MTEETYSSRGVLSVSALGPGFEAWPWHCVVFLGETLEWVPELSGNPDVMLGGSLRMDWHPIQWGVVIFLVASSHGGNRDKHWLDGTLGLTDFLLVKRLGLLLHFYRVTVCWYPWILLVRERRWEKRTHWTRFRLKPRPLAVLVPVYVLTWQPIGNCILKPKRGKNSKTRKPSFIVQPFLVVFGGFVMSMFD